MQFYEYEFETMSLEYAQDQFISRESYMYATAASLKFRYDFHLLARQPDEPILILMTFAHVTNLLLPSLLSFAFLPWAYEAQL